MIFEKDVIVDSLYDGPRWFLSPGIHTIMYSLLFVFGLIEMIGCGLILKLCPTLVIPWTVAC